MLYWYNWFSWWWAHGYSKHVGYWNKHIQKRIVLQFVYLQELYRDARSSEHKNPIFFGRLNTHLTQQRSSAWIGYIALLTSSKILFFVFFFFQIILTYLRVCYTGVLISPYPYQKGNKLKRPNSNFCKPLKNNSEGCPSNQVSAAAMTSASDEKWRNFNCFFQSGQAKDLSAPLY